MEEQRELFNIEAEQELLGALTSNEGKKYLERITENLFYRESHKLIYRAIKSVLVDDGASVADLTSVTDKLTRQGKMADVGLETIMTIANKGRLVVNFSQYLDTVRDYAEQRQLKQFAMSLLSELNAPSDFKRASEIRDEYKDKLSKIRSSVTDGEYKELTDKAALMNFFDHIMDEDRGKCYPTRLPRLDRALKGGLHEQLVYVLGAVSGLGKTTFAMQIACNIAKGGNDVLFFSLEMSQDELMARNISRHTAELSVAKFNNVRIAKNYSDILCGSDFLRLREDEQQFVYDAIDEYSKYAEHLYTIQCSFGFTVEQVRSRIVRHIEATGRKPVVFIDYMQVLGTELEKQGRNITDKQKADRIINFLKTTSRDLKIPIMLISSFNREAYNNPVDMNSCKDSGGIEYTTDCLMGMQLSGMGVEKGENLRGGERAGRIQELKDKVREKKSKGEAVDIEVKIIKTRRGVEGTIDYNFFSRFSLFQEKRNYTPTEATAQ